MAVQCACINSSQYLLTVSSMSGQLHVLIEISCICSHCEDVNNKLSYSQLSKSRSHLVLWYLWLSICLAASLQLIRSLSTGIKIRVCPSSVPAQDVDGAAVVCLQNSSTLLLLLAPNVQGQCPHYRGQMSSSLSYSLAGQIQMLISLVLRCAFVLALHLMC